MVAGGPIIYPRLPPGAQPAASTENVTVDTTRPRGRGARGEGGFGAAAKREALGPGETMSQRRRMSIAIAEGSYSSPSLGLALQPALAAGQHTFSYSPPHPLPLCANRRSSAPKPKMQRARWVGWAACGLGQRAQSSGAGRHYLCVGRLLGLTGAASATTAYPGGP